MNQHNMALANKIKTDRIIESTNNETGILFSCYCALRISDVVGLSWGDIHKDGDQWRVFTVMEKTNEPIYLPLSKQAMKWLPERGDAKDGDKVFDLPSESRICIILDKCAKAAGINNTSPTTLSATPLPP